MHIDDMYGVWKILINCFVGSVCYHFINEELLCTGHTLLKGGTGPLTIGANVTSLLKEGIPRIMKLSRANAALDDEEKMIKVSPSMGPTTYLNNEIEDNPIRINEVAFLKGNWLSGRY